MIGIDQIVKSTGRKRSGRLCPASTMSSDAWPDISCCDEKTQPALRLGAFTRLADGARGSTIDLAIKGLEFVEGAAYTHLVNDFCGRGCTFRNRN
jgi:hypothetical protein